MIFDNRIILSSLVKIGYETLIYQTEQVHICWNEEMQVIRISSQDILAKMNYDFKGDLAKLDIYYQEELVLEIIVDEIIYK